MFTRRAVLAGAAIVPFACTSRSRAQAETVSVLDFVPARLHDSVRTGAPASDLTPYFQQALATARQVHVPAGVYPVTEIQIGAERSLLTDGAATRFRQLPAAPDDACVLLVEGSDVVVGDCTIEGLIRRFRAGGSEFNHGVQVRARRGAAAVRNVQVGNVRGKDLCGDAVYIHCDLGAELDGVRIGNVFGENVLRNIVAIVGGRNIEIGEIDGTACGYAAFDIEPEGTYSAAVEGVRVRSVRGSCCSIGANPDTYIRNVEIGRLDTDPSHAPNSTPPYVDRRGAPFRLNASGLRLRNATGIVIGSHRARNHADLAVNAIGDERRRHPFERTLRIGQIDYSGIGRNERNYYTLVNASALEQVTIGGGQATVSSDAQSLILGRDGGTSCRIENVRVNGLVARHVQRSEFRGLTVEAGETRGVLQNVSDSRIVGSTLRAGYLGYNLTDLVVEDSTIAWLPGGPYLVGGNARNVRLQRTMVNRRRLDNQLFDPNDAAALR